MGVFIAITSVGIDFTTFAFIAGAFTFWIGFGLLPLIQNFVAGIIILLDKNIKVGDYLVLDSGEKGIVSDITIRTMLLETLEGHKIVIPNAELVIKKFTNKSISENFHRVSIPFKIAYTTERKKVCELIIEAAQKIPYTRSDCLPQVWMKSFNDENIDLSLIVWVNSSLINKQSASIESIYLWAIDTTLQEHNIQFPCSK
jgi:small-conductance mechanosensitive channel